MKYDYDSIQLYIFNWKKVNKNSVNLYIKIKQHIKNVKLVNSDEHFFIHDHINNIQLDDNYYYGGQFNECIKDADPNKILGIIVGDTLDEINFEKLFQNLLYTFNNYKTGIYTINDKRSFHKKKQNKLLCEEKSLFTVKNSDCGIWFINPKIHQILKNINYQDLTPFGWGIDIIAVKECNKMNLLVIKDLSIDCDQIDHTTNYSSKLANIGKKKLVEYYNNLYFFCFFPSKFFNSSFCSFNSSSSLNFFFRQFAMCNRCFFCYSF